VLCWREQKIFVCLTVTFFGKYLLIPFALGVYTYKLIRGHEYGKYWTIINPVRWD